jgi:CheY-like chemotaxis protein
MTKETERKVLIVEDDPVVCKLTANLLEKERNLKAQCATSGEDAVRAWRDGKFDVILMDIRMQGMDGIETAKLIRELERTYGRKRAKIIAYSAVADQNTIESSFEAEFDDYISKPTTLAKIMDKIERSLSTH